MAEEPSSGPQEPGEGSEPQDEEPQTFDAEYVKQLRTENKERRQTASDLENKNTALAQRLLDTTVSATCKELADPTDLLHYTSAADLMDEDGLPDEHKILQAEANLIKLKPHLRSRIPKGTIEQGARGEEVEGFSFNNWLRDSAG